MEKIYFLLGMIGMQLVYLLYHFILFKKREFLYFLLFTLGVATFVWSLHDAQLVFEKEGLYPENARPLSFSFLFIALGIYYRFTRVFIDAPKLHPRYNRIMIFPEIIAYVTSAILALKAFVYTTSTLIITYGKLIFFINIPIQVFLFIYLLRTKNIYNYMLVVGSLLMTLFFKAGIVPIIFGDNSTFNYQDNLFYLLLGLVVNFMFFNFILINKFRSSEKQQVIYEYKRQEALELQRREISNDLHDDLGSILSSIHIYASVATKDYVAGGKKTLNYLSIIAERIQLAMENMSDVVWAARNEYTNEKSFSSRLKDFFLDTFEARRIRCTYEIDPATEMNIQGLLSRKYLLLIAKEAINNIIKHSSADNIKVALTTEQNSLRLAIEDNGKGFNNNSQTSGNGLSSMKERASRLGGEIIVQSAVGKGALIECLIPIPTIREV